MKIFHRYIAVRFLKPFLFGLALFALLIFLGDLFDKMPRLVRSKASIGVILQYLWLGVPYWTTRIMPMATLLATLFAVTGFVSSGEWAAVQAAGFETKAFLRPILVLALAVTGLAFLAQETVLPFCFARAQTLWRDKIHPQWEWDKYEDVILYGGAGQFITAKQFFPKEGRMERPVMDYYGGGRVRRQLDARRSLWDGARTRWVFLEGVERTFAEGQAPVERPFERLETDLDAPPLTLVPRHKNPDEMSLLETRRYLRQVSYLGTSPREAATAVQLKLAYPFANLIVCALGIPIALRLRRSNRGVSIAVALGVSFAYLWVLEMGKALGNAGRVAPWVAAWTPNLLFAGLAAWFHRRTEL